MAQGQELSQLGAWYAMDDGAALLSVTFNPPRRSSAQSVPWTDQNKAMGNRLHADNGYNGCIWPDRSPMTSISFPLPLEPAFTRLDTLPSSTTTRNPSPVISALASKTSKLCEHLCFGEILQIAVITLVLNLLTTEVGKVQSY